MENKVDMKKSIALILPPWLPVPAVKGGAIETLVTLLIDENEKYGRCVFHVFSIFDKTAYSIAQYRNSVIHYVQKEEQTFVTYVKSFLLRCIRKCTLHRIIISDYYRKVFSICRHIKIDFFVAEGGDAFEFREFSKYFGKKKMVYHFHGHFFCREIMTYFGSTISVSHFIKDAWLESCRKKGYYNIQQNFVVTNAVDEDLFLKEFLPERRRELRRSFGVLEDDILVMYIGRIVEVKGVLELIQAILCIQNPKVKLLIVGSVNFANAVTSEYHKKVLHLIAKHPNRLMQCGYIDNSEVYKYNKCADIRVMPSKWEEAGSLALVETMYAAVPMIITRSGGMPEVVNKEGAIIIDKGKQLVSNLVTAIESLVNNPEKRSRMSEANRVHSKYFRKEHFYNSYVDVFDRIAEQ